MPSEWEKAEGSPAPLGATWIESEKAYNFALYAKSATAVTLELYNDGDLSTPLASIPLTFPQNKTSRIWHKRVPQSVAANAKYYAYRVDGPADTKRGYRFDTSKVLLDPYAKSVLFPPAYDRAAAIRAGSNAGKAPLGILPPANSIGVASRPDGPRHGHDLVVYEMHVRGFTQHNSSGVATAARGTFAGVIEKIPYLKALGITAVELMPIHQFEPNAGNYWGYMTLNFFSPHAQYASSPAGAFDEFSHMVDEFHKAGIEVFLDVVYNHSCEMGDGGPTYSFRGIDNSAYYALDSKNLDVYWNSSGCGNDMRTAHPVVRRLVVDSLRYWAKHGNVDGFRFDLASIFARNDDGSVNTDDPPIISEISSHPDLANMRLIAEPWDLGAYLIGRQFPGVTWRQWNDHFRNTARCFVKGDPGLISDLMTRLYGSTDLFGDDIANACRPAQSVNYVDSHDGLSLFDLVAYTNDGQRSWNCGYQGVAGVPPEVDTLRRQQMKNFCCLLMLANGTPMFVAGDEFGHTQNGNDNPYDQDNPTTWLDWSFATANADILRFFSKMIAFRKAHPSIGRSTGWGNDVSWHGTGVEPDLGAGSRVLAFHLRGASAADKDIYVMFNTYWEALDFAIAAPGAWRCVVDTSRASPSDIVDESAAPLLGSTLYNVAGRSTVVLVAA